MGRGRGEVDGQEGRGMKVGEYERVTEVGGVKVEVEGN